VINLLTPKHPTKPPTVPEIIVTSPFALPVKQLSVHPAVLVSNSSGEGDRFFEPLEMTSVASLRAASSCCICGATADARASFSDSVLEGMVATVLSFVC
jgi:hypothetical protein